MKKILYLLAGLVISYFTFKPLSILFIFALFFAIPFTFFNGIYKLSMKPSQNRMKKVKIYNTRPIEKIDE